MHKQLTRKIQGISLVSLLISIALGAFLMVVMLQIFAANQANYKLSQNLSEMNNILRYVSLSMSNIIGQAGYRTFDTGTQTLPSYTTAFPVFTNTLTGPTGSTYSTTDPNSDNPAGVVLSYFPGQNVFVSSTGTDTGDKLWVKFQGDASGRIQACNDLYGVEGVAIMVRFYSRGTTVSGVNNAPGYYCQRQDNGTNYAYGATVTGTELIPPALFDSAWVRYGEDLTGNGYIDRWSLGDDVQNRNRVYAVRFAFLIHSRDDVRKADTTQTFEVFGDTITRTSKKIYKLYMFSVLLPNAPNYPLASIVAVP